MLMKLVGAKALVIAAAVTALTLGADAAEAVVCIANHTATNPDATLTNSDLCGPGDSGNESAAALATAVPGDQTFTLKDKDGDDAATLNANDGGFLVTGTRVGGSWFIDTAGDAAGSDYFIVIKDGSVAQDAPTWFWFRVDETLLTAGGCSLGTVYEFCGTWTMYGDDGKLKEVSHMSLYTTPGLPPPPPPGDLPIPGTAWLVALGVLGLTYRRRRAAA